MLPKYTFLLCILHAVVNINMKRWKFCEFSAILTQHCFKFYLDDTVFSHSFCCLVMTTTSWCMLAIIKRISPLVLILILFSLGFKMLTALLALFWRPKWHQNRHRSPHKLNKEQWNIQVQVVFWINQKPHVHHHYSETTPSSEEIFLLKLTVWFHSLFLSSVSFYCLLSFHLI